MSSPRHSPPPSAAAPKPKGILKNASDRRPSQGAALGPDDDANGKLQWDETNLTLHEIERENQDARMIIDEPKTPFVRGTSLGPVGDEDPFDLDASSQGASSSANSSRRGSTVQQVAANTAANAGRASTGAPHLGLAVGLDAADVIKKNSDTLDGDSSSGPSSARTTSRSPSFSLPPKSPSSRRSSSRSAGVADERSGIRQEVHDMDVDTSANDDGAVEEEDPDPETQAKHAAFAAKRNQHYGNEAEAMKVAAALAAQDPDDDEDEGLPPLPNGRA